MTSLGIDIGGTSVKAALIDGGNVVATRMSAGFSRPDTARLVEAVREAVGDADRSRIRAVGFCCPGVLDRASRTITLSVNVPGLVGVSLDEIVSRALGPGLPAPAIMSDASAVAYDI